MTNRNDHLPLRGLEIFEVAGRIGNFTAASEALGMTQTAVSQHIARLEAEIGAALFVRRHRGVGLTAIGMALHGTVRQGLATLAEGVAIARRQARPGSLQILTDFGLAYSWLMPRMAQLQALLPGVEIRVATTTVDLDATDAAFDMAVMLGDGRWPGYRTTSLFGEVVYPVASGTLVGTGEGMPARAIAALPLVHLKGSAAARSLGWADWFAAQGCERAPAETDMYVDNYQLALEAALAGHGACLGWTPLVDDAVAAGRLVRLSPVTLAGTRGYYLVEHGDSEPSASIAILRDWLRAARPIDAGPVDAGPDHPTPAGDTHARGRANVPQSA